MAEFTATIDDTADLADSASGEVEFLRAIDEAVTVADAMARATDSARAISDSAAVSDAAISATVIAISFADAVTLSDDVDVKAFIVEDVVVATDQLDVALVTLNVVIADAIDAPDQLASFLGSFGAFVLGDVLMVTDSIARGLTRSITISDSRSVTDQLKRTAFFGRPTSDAVVASDALTSTPTLALSISEAHALSESRVRVTFDAPALNDAALATPANYLFDNLSAGTVDVTPLSVFIPPGQPQPLYVEIDTTEHTDAGSYQVALSASIRGGAGEYGDGVPYPYTGIGVAPLIAVVIATSPTTAEVHFTEAIANNVDARSKYNYTWTGGLQTLEVLSVIGEVVTLRTSAQVPGTLYTLTVTATEPIAADIQISDSLAVADDLASKLEPIRVEILDDLVDGVADSVTVLLIRRLALAAGNYIAPSSVTGVQSSLDAVTWNDEAPGFFSLEGVSVWDAGYGDNLNVVVGDGVVYRSYGDGTWVGAYGLGDSLSVAYSPSLGLWVVGVHTGWVVSSDAISWTYYPISLSPFDSFMWIVRWCETLGLFISGGDYFSGRIWTSPDGVNWTGHDPSTAFGGRWHGIAWNEAAGLLAIAGGDSGDPDNLQTSPDGSTWTRQTPGSGYTGPWRNIAASATRFVVVGYNGSPQVQISDDGVTWTAQSFAGGYTGQPTGLTYRDDLGLFIMCGSLGEIQTSPDGVTWTHRSLGGGITNANLRGAA